MPCSRARSISPRVVGQSCACISPPRQRRAAAVSTAWRVPPIPIARWSFVPRIAAEIEAVTSPSWISLMRAPATRISSIRSWWRGRSRTIVVTSATRRPKAVGDRLDVLGDRPLEVDLAAGHGADRHLAHVHVRQGRERAAAGLRRSSTSPRRRRARRCPTPSSGSRARSAGVAARLRFARRPQAAPASAEAPMTMCPSIGSCSSASCMPAHAASCAPSWSARPSQRALARAERSVTRA